MAYATIPADVETNESAQPLVVNKQTPLRRLVAGAALASFVLGVLAATAVRSASAPLTTNFISEPAVPGDFFNVQLRSVMDVRDADVCLTLNPEEAKKAYLPGDKVPLELHRCYDKSAHKRGQIFSFEGGVDSPRHLTSWPGGTKLCLATDQKSLWFTPCNDKDKEQDFSFEELDANKVTMYNGFPDYKPHGKFGNIKSKAGKCFGVDYSVSYLYRESPTMTDCGKDYKTKGDLEFYNAWELIQH